MNFVRQLSLKPIKNLIKSQPMVRNFFIHDGEEFLKLRQLINKLKPGHKIAMKLLIGDSEPENVSPFDSVGPRGPDNKPRE